MKVLIACEFSGIVRDAFRARGHDAWSCDILPCEADPTYHLEGNIVRRPIFLPSPSDLAILDQNPPRPWDLMIAHPPCTHLAVSGTRWFKGKRKEQEEAVEFFMALANAPIPRICIENPVCIMSTRWRKPNQYIQPWQFGHGETKKTGLWLKNLPLLKPTKIVEGREGRVWKMGPSPTRAKDRSRTYQGIADAMAEQWGA